VVALAEHWGHGSDAAGLVRDVIKVYFDKKARLAAENRTKDAAVGVKVGALQNLGLPTQPPAIPLETPAANPETVGTGGEAADAAPPRPESATPAENARKTPQ
jgi:hypothetical protein